MTHYDFVIDLKTEEEIDNEIARLNESMTDFQLHSLTYYLISNLSCDLLEDYSLDLSLYGATFELSLYHKISRAVTEYVIKDFSTGFKSTKIPLRKDYIAKIVKKLPDIIEYKSDY